MRELREISCKTFHKKPISFNIDDSPTVFCPELHYRCILKILYDHLISYTSYICNILYQLYMSYLIPVIYVICTRMSLSVFFQYFFDQHIWWRFCIFWISTILLLQKRCSLKFRTIQKKIPVLESLFNKVAGLKAAALLKRDSNTGVFLRILRNFKEQPFYRAPLRAAFMDLR